MGVKTLIGPADQFAIEPPLATAGLVARNEQDGFTFGIEREGDPSLTGNRGKAKFLHVGVTRAV